MVKPVILTFVGCYLPGYRGGGPIRTIANMVDRLGDDFEFRIVTMDRDLSSTQPYEGVGIDQWNSVGRAQVFYASPSARSFGSIRSLIQKTPHDLLYLNGFFNPIFTLRPMLVRKIYPALRCPTIVAPRGEFSENALHIKRWKKLLYIELGRVVGLFDDVLWHASTEFEAGDIKKIRRVNFNDIKIAKNISENLKKTELGFLQSKASAGAPLRVCFLSRIAPMKNLAFALNVLAQTKNPIEFSIYGPKESSLYWGECQKLIDGLPSHVRVTYEGSVEPSQVRKVIGKHDIFFVPTQGENFGHVFVEAFSAGVPVLVSDRTPWRGLRDLNIGWDFALDRPEEFSNVLDEFSNYDEFRRNQMRVACVNFALETMESEEVLSMNRMLFLDALRRNAVDLPRN